MFRTELDLPASPFQLGLSSKVVTAGSCFSDVMGQKLQHYKVDALVNPFGTIFNPVSLCQLLEMACSQNHDLEEHLVQHNDIWYHYAFHSSFSSPDQQALLEQMKTALDQTQGYLRSAQLLVLTFGTAVAYELKDEGTVVANCHKLPDQNFERRLLSYYEMVDAFGAMCAHLKTLNPELKILLTVSPVRHLKETIQLNSVSKAHLRMACHHFTENFPDVFYFPAFELMLDDLRDYRFYKDDMIHPSSLAENYIWQKFTKAFFGDEFHSFLSEWDQIQKSLSHTPFHPESKGHQYFLRNLLSSLHRLAQKVDVKEEIERVRQQLRPEPEKKVPERRPQPSPPERPAPEEQEAEQEAPAEMTQAPEVTDAQPAPAPGPIRDRNQPRPDKNRKNKKGRGKKVVLEPVDRKKAPEPEPAQAPVAAPTPVSPAPAPVPASLPVAIEKRAERPIKVLKQKPPKESVAATPPPEGPTPAGQSQPEPPAQPAAPQPQQVELPPVQQQPAQPTGPKPVRSPQPQRTGKQLPQLFDQSQPAAAPQPAAPELPAPPLPAPEPAAVPPAPAATLPKKRPPRKKPAPKPVSAEAQVPSQPPAPALTAAPPPPEASPVSAPPKKPRKPPVSRKRGQESQAPPPPPEA